MKAITLTAMLLAASQGLCQTPAKEPDTLQSLLVEVHQLRLDIEAMTVASQRVQIALYAFQMQDAAVARASQRLDSMRDRCKGQEADRQHAARDRQLAEAELASGTNDANRVGLRAVATQRKDSLDAQTTDVQACQATEAEAANQFRNEQTKLTELQDRIARLDKTLEQLGGR